MGQLFRERARKEQSGAMPMFMDQHRHVEGLTAEAVAEAHRKDEEIQDEYGVKYLKYWFNEDTGEVLRSKFQHAHVSGLPGSNNDNPIRYSLGLKRVSQLHGALTEMSPTIRMNR